MNENERNSERNENENGNEDGEGTRHCVTLYHHIHYLPSNAVNTANNVVIVVVVVVVRPRRASRAHDGTAVLRSART